MTSAIYNVGLQPFRNLSDVASVATSKTNLALDQVDNTSDVNKPVSTAQAAAIALKVALAGAENITGAKTFDAGPILSNNIVLKGKETGGTARELVQMNTSNYAQFGDVNTNTLYKGVSHSFNVTPLVVADPVMTRGASETVTGAKTHSGALIVGGAANSDFRLNAPDAGAAYITIQRNSANKWLVGRNISSAPTGDDLQFYNVGLSAYGLIFTYSSNLATFGAGVTVTGPLIANGAATFNANSSFASSGVPLTINSTNSNTYKLALQDNGVVRGYLGNDGTYCWRFGTAGVTSCIDITNSSGLVNIVFALQVGGKSALSHAGAYTSGQVTYSTSAPSGGSDGDVWFQYV